MDLTHHGPDEPTLLSNSSDPLSSPPGSSDDVPGRRPSAPSIGRNPNFSAVPPLAHPISTTSAPAAFYLHAFDPPALGGSDRPDAQTVAAPKKPGRKRKVVNPDQAAEKPIKEPKKSGRKPRVLKDPNAAPAQRKQKTDAAPPSAMDQPPPSRGSKISDLVTMQVSPQNARISSPNSRPSGIYAPPPPGTPSRPATSGQMFDPIRGSTIEKPPPSPTPFLQNRASASPSIKSLIDPPPPTSQPTRLPTTSTNVHKPSPSRNPQPNSTPSAPKPFDDEKLNRKLDSGPSSTNPTPPPKQRNKEPAPPPPPLPKGSGLLSGTPFGISAAGANGATGTAPERGTNIWISFALKGKENVTINFSHEVETKYGLGALNPRLAARRERQRQMALAGAELERQQRGGGGSTAGEDDMSVDMSEGEGGSDTDVVMKDAAEASKEPETKKRKRKAEDYDRNDDFIDDAELLLEEQALMSKDGFFVYSGPLIEEGEKPAVERCVSPCWTAIQVTHDLRRADGTTKRGRGRGRGTGSRGGASAATNGAGAGSGTEGAGSGTGGRGSRGGRGRGGATVRKPRVTKAERALMEQEKLNREKMAASLATKPAQYASAMI
jgi:hypothetical protein